MTHNIADVWIECFFENEIVQVDMVMLLAEKKNFF